MKIAKYTALAFTLLAGFASATITLNPTFGVATNASGAAVPDGTLWIMVVDNGDNSFAGGFGLGQSLTNSATATSAFAGTNLSIGALLGGDTIFAMGGFNGVGSFGEAGLFSGALPGLNLGENGLAAGQEFAFYWFPGVTFTSNGTYQAGSQVGGIHDAGTDAASGFESMIIPADGSSTSPGAGNTTAGGTLPNSRFTAVQLVPEPSTMLLGAFGALGLLRRRR